MICLDKFTKQYLERYRHENVKPPGSLVSAAIYFLPARHRQTLQHYIEDTIRHPVCIESLFNIQPSITTSNIDLCTAYWNQVVQFLQSCEGADNILFMLCSR